VQLILAFRDPPDRPPEPSAPPVPWDQIGAAAGRAALDLLARLIARMLAAAAGGGWR
jgi:hypothetical protein